MYIQRHTMQKNDKSDTEQTFNTQFDAAPKLLKKNYAFLFLLLFSN